MENRRYWPRIVLTLPPAADEALHDIAARNYRDPKREALRLLIAGIASEASDDTEPSLADALAALAEALAAESRAR